MNKCRLCLRGNLVPGFSAVDRLHGIPGRFRYAVCGHCGTWSLDPLLESQDLADYYPAEYAPHAVAEEGEDFMESRLHQKTLAGYSHFQIMSALLACASRTPDKWRILDVGCGNGMFLRTVRHRWGCEAHGLDFSDAAVGALRANGIPAMRGTIEEAAFEPEFFDFITAWWYLEHVREPRQALERMRVFLKPGGVLVLGVPNARGLVARLFRGKWYHLDCPRHQHLPTPKAMELLARDLGFRIRRIVYDVSPWGLMGSLQYLCFGKAHGTRFNLSRIMPLRVLFRPLTRLTAFFRISDTMICILEKA